LPHLGYPGGTPGEGTATNHNPPLGLAFSPSRQQEGSRALSYGLREASRLLLASFPEFRGHLSCGLPVAHEDRPLEVALYHDSEGFRVGFHGLMTCGSPWICPVCAPTLAEQRGEALARTLEYFHRIGFRIVHVVLTVRHTRGEALADVFKALADAWRRMGKSRAFRPHWEGLGYARSVEITFGKNGWHPHIHLALVVPPERDPYALREALWQAWSGAVLEVGWAPSSRDAYFYDIVERSEDISEVAHYVAKTTNWGIGPEITGGVRKKSTEGLVPFQLLGAAWWGYLEDPESMASWFPERPDDLEDPAPWLPGARRLAEGGGLILREFCRASFWRAKSLGVPPEEAAYRWLEFAESTKARKALTLSRSIGLVFKKKLEEVESENKKRVPVEVIHLTRHIYLYLLHRGKLSYLVYLAESLGSLRRACELLGLVEGYEWTTPPANAPPSLS